MTTLKINNMYLGVIFIIHLLKFALSSSQIHLTLKNVLASCKRGSVNELSIFTCMLFLSPWKWVIYFPPLSAIPLFKKTFNSGNCLLISPSPSPSSSSCSSLAGVLHCGRRHQLYGELGMLGLFYNSWRIKFG